MFLKCFYFLPLNNSKLVYNFKLLSLKPMEGTRAIHLTMLAFEGKILLSILMPNVMCLYFCMQAEDILVIEGL